MTTVVLIGATGFVGAQVRTALQRRGAAVRCVAAPRLTTASRELAPLVEEVREWQQSQEGRALAKSLVGCDAVVNAAGVAAATGGGDQLFGANALLPGVLASLAPDNARVVHVSSAAVQGRRKVLQESAAVAPFSPYSASKALGEMALWNFRQDAVCYRPTSVHGDGRDVTRSLIKFVSSPLASVAGSGKRPTPQALVENVGDAAAFLAVTSESPPRVVLYPGEGMTTGELVRMLGGREPLHLPVWLARLIVAIAFLLGRAVPPSAGIARRLEILWFGQSQGYSWLTERWSPVKGIDSWKELA